MKNVVIVGSGLSGLSCAYHLKKNGINASIYDQSNQLGGRIFSDNIDGFVCDNESRFESNCFEGGGGGVVCALATIKHRIGYRMFIGCLQDF